MSGLVPISIRVRGPVDLGGGIVPEGVVLSDGSTGFTTAQIEAVFGASKNRHFARSIARIPRETGPLSVRPTCIPGAGARVDIYTTADVAAVCFAYVAALAAGKLHPKQVPLAHRAALILAASSAAGLHVLVCETLGCASSARDAYEATQAQMAAAAFESSVAVRIAAAVDAARAPLLAELASRATPSPTITRDDHRELSRLLAALVRLYAAARGVSEECARATPSRLRVFCSTSRALSRAALTHAARLTRATGGNHANHV